MKPAMRPVIRCLFLLFLSSPGIVYAQGVVFGYDNAGNRVRRVVQSASDLTPFLTVTPTYTAGAVNMTMRVRVLNLNSSYGLPTNGQTITVRILKSALWNFTWDGSATSNALGSLTNSIWTYSSTGSFHTWTTNDVLAVGSSRYLGFTGPFNAGATSGMTTITVQIVALSGGEINVLNNSDVEKITYDPAP